MIAARCFSSAWRKSELSRLNPNVIIRRDTAERWKKNKGQQSMMKVSWFAFAATVMAVTAPTQSRAVPLVLNPVDDGRVNPLLVTTTDYLIAGDGSNLGRGVLEFSTANFLGEVQTALLSVNPYGLPLGSPTMRVFGYESSNGRVDLSDYSAGVLLGDWTLPQGLGYGQEAFFDVSEFLRNVRSPFVGFVLQGFLDPQIAAGFNVLSSLEFNYGRPAQLTVDTVAVPEPGSLAVFAAGLLAMIAGVRVRRLAS